MVLYKGVKCSPTRNRNKIIAEMARKSPHWIFVFINSSMCKLQY